MEGEGKLSGLFRYITLRKGQIITIRSSNLDDLLNDPIIPATNDIEKKLKLLLDYFRLKTSKLGEIIRFDMKHDYPVNFSIDEEEFHNYLLHLTQRGLISKGKIDVAGHESHYLTVEGWAELEKNIAGTKQGFIACWFDNSMNKTIKTIEEVIKNCGFEPQCIKDKYYSDTIMDKALGEISKSKFIVVDLTGKRPSVFFEAGYAHGLRKDIIFVMSEKQKSEEDEGELEFYTKHYKILFYKDEEELKEKLKNAIIARIYTT